VRLPGNQKRAALRGAVKKGNRKSCSTNHRIAANKSSRERQAAPLVAGSLVPLVQDMVSTITRTTRKVLPEFRSISAIAIRIPKSFAIYRAANRRRAERAFRRWAKRWQKPRPKAVACVERDLEQLLNFFSMPQQHWKKVRTTNVIERAFREVRRRTRPMSSSTNPASCERIVFGVINHLNSSWEKKPLKEFTQNACR
jgi:Transposase, Mutator family